MIVVEINRLQTVNILNRNSLEKVILGVRMTAKSLAAILGLYPGFSTKSMVSNRVPPENSKLDPKTTVMACAVLEPSV